MKAGRCHTALASEFGLHSSGQNLLVPCIFIYEEVGPKTRIRLRQRLLWALLLRFRGRLYKKVFSGSRSKMDWYKTGFSNWGERTFVKG